MEKLHFIVADCPFIVFASEEKVIKSLLPTFAPFHVSAEKVEKPVFIVEIEAPVEDTAETGQALGHFDSGGTFHDVYRHANGGYTIVVTSPEGDKCATMTTNSDFSHCTITPISSATSYKYGVNNEMMIAFAFASARQGVLMMHASVTTNHGRGYLFLGTSGTGKSTHSGLWRKHIPGSQLLNDDNPAVRITQKGPVVYGTPWSGKTPCYKNLSAPVGGFVDLKQASANSIERLGGLEAFIPVYNSCSVMAWDKEIQSLVMKAVEEAVMAPVFRLFCLPDEEAARLCHQTLQRAER